MYNKDNLILESLYLQKVIKENTNKHAFEYAGIELYNNTLKSMSRQQVDDWVEDIYAKMEVLDRRKDIRMFSDEYNAERNKIQPYGMHISLVIYTIMGVAKEPDTVLANKKPYKVTDSRDWYTTLSDHTDYFMKINGNPCYLFKREYDDSMDENYDDDEDEDKPMAWVWAIENLFDPEEGEVETNSNDIAEARREYLGEAV
jgi:hypothetical protein